MPYIDLTFQLTGTQPIPADHGYFLYSAVSRLLPDVHRENGIAVHPIRGLQIGDRLLSLTESSRLTLRVRDEGIAGLLTLAGKQLRIGGTSVRVGVPHVECLKLAPALRSRLVIIKISGTDAAALTEQNFAAAARKQLTSLGISPTADLVIGKRRTLRMKDKEIVGYEVVVDALTPSDSTRLQEDGLGGKRHMGCGVFVPALKTEKI